MSKEKPSDEKPAAEHLRGKVAHAPFRATSGVIWQHASFAHRWFDDALNELPGHRATQAEHRNNVRRQIVFSLCFIESWLYEWVRDELLQRDFRKLDLYFPPGVHRSVAQRVRDVLTQLYRDGRLSQAPDFGATGEVWPDFIRLIDARNGLVHAGASRPLTPGMPERGKPTPELSVLDEYIPDLPLRVVIAVVDLLCMWAGRDRPDWIRLPGH